MFQSVGRILRWAKGYRRRMLLGFVCSFFATWCTAGPVMLAAWALGRLIGNAWGENELPASLPWLCLGGIVVLILLRFFFTYWKNRLQESIGTERAADQRMELGNVLKRVSLGYFARNNLGDILTALTTELSTLELQSMKMVDAVINGYIQVAVILLCVAIFCPPAALVALLGVLMSAFALRGIGRQSACTAPVGHRAQEALSGAAIEYIYALPVVKSFGQDGVSVQRFRKACRDNKAIRIKNEFGFVPWNCPASVCPAGGVRGAGPYCRTAGFGGRSAAPIFSDDRPVLLHHLRQCGGHQRRGTRPVGDGLGAGPAGGTGAHRLHRQGRPGDRPGEVRCGPLPCILWLRPTGGAPRCDLHRAPGDHHRHRGAVRLRQEHHLQPGGPVL